MFLWLAAARGIPEGPEGSVLGRDRAQALHLALVAVIGVALLAGLRFPTAAGWAVAVAAIGLGALAAVEYSVPAAFGVAAAFLVPAVLLLAARAPRRSQPAGWAVAAALAVLLGAGWMAADAAHRVAFGPFHPTSATPRLEVVSVRWMWSGGVTVDGFRVVARLRRPGAVARLVVGTRPDLAGAVAMPAATADADGVVRLAATGLAPDRAHTYAIEVDGRRDDPRRGTVRTLPRGPASFVIAVGSCATTGSNGRVFDTIREARPLLYVQTGDLFYANIDRDRERSFLDAFDATLSSPAQAALYRSVPVAYTWDDHDYGPNDSDRTSPSRPAALAAYRRLVPHGTLALPGVEAPIAQAFTVGRVRFILTDGRSMRVPTTTPDGPAKTMLGARQRAWLLAEAEGATRAGLLPVWVSSTGWIGPPAPGTDGWPGYAWERRRIADELGRRGVDSLVMLSGDLHMVAADDGTNSGYRTGGGGGFPVLQAAALDEAGSGGGGPYSAGLRRGSGQFGLMRVTDDGGGTIRVELEGRDWRGTRILGVTAELPVGGGPR